ncbi:MAG TPA: hypothetical protein VMZ33_03060 [Candidatus Limnocylindrales bacterium]|nr:hypothetical protein [Candidatus Limnocylindrales bacterium]
MPLAAFGFLLLPGPVAAHTLTERYQAPLPLIAYVAGAALAVAMSFVFVMLRGATPAIALAEARSRTVPAWLRGLLSASGLIAWLWIVVQALGNGQGSGDVASLFLWVYGWVGVALVCALVGPAWAWLDPFSTIHRILGAIGSRIGLSGSEPADYPGRFGQWPAVVGFALIVWIELVARIEGGRTLGLLLVAYTLISVAGMSYFGRDTWRRNAELFSVWFGILGRLAPFALEDEPEDGRVVRRSFASGLLAQRWTVAELVIVALGTGSIIFDGLSQTQIYFDLFGGVSILGLPTVRDTLILGAFLGLLVTVVLIVARRLSVDALGAGLLPVAVGYLVAHYFTFLLVDGQRIINAINDPLLSGANLLPPQFAFYEPSLPLSPAITWSIQLAAVVGGHVIGAWAGHAALAEDEPDAPMHRQLPLATLMVVLTSVTLWSLGQAVLSGPAS